jgi:ribulose-5-phosphate 4-epimerase/fuculose-1-phosphate aldolase
VYRDSTETRKQIVQTGRATWELGLNSLKSGNISVLLPNRRILITKTGRSLRNLKPRKDLTTVPRSQTGRGEASCEFDVHRAIYEITGCAGGAGAILHCHPPCSIAASSLLRRAIPPAYNEPSDVLGQTVIVESRDRESLGEDPAVIGGALSMNKIIAVRAHGTFALAETLEQCLYLTHLLESSCRVLFLRSNGHRFSSLFEEASGAIGSVVKLQAGALGGQARK